MAPLDSAAPIPDITGDEPAGENLEFDSEFAELERLAQGKPEQQYGATIVPAEEPEWKDVVACARSLMERTHDLRVLAQLGVGRLNREGLAGYADTLAIVRQVLETRWEAVHPQLDPEDDNDPTLRANALLRLAEPVRVLRFLRYMPLARSVRAGAVSWRDISITLGTVETPAKTEKMKPAVISAAFNETDPALLASLRESLEAAASHSVAIPALFDENAGHGTGPDFTELTKLLREMLGMLDTYAKAAPPEPDAEEETEAQPGAPTAVVVAAAPVMSIATMGPPTNRRDATRLLELVIQYYEQNEPSSPLPLLIGRARRLAEKGFMDILRDMAPDGVNQAEMLAGKPE